MTRKRRNLMLASAVGTVMAGVLAATCDGGAKAAEPPFGDRRITITAREQPVGAFLQAFFGQMGLSVSVSPSIGGTINGAWNDRATKVYGDISRAFNLLTYFDGQTVYVSPVSEAATRTLPAAPGVAAQARSRLNRMGLPDAQNRVRVADRALIATGSRRFLDQVEQVMRGQEDGFDSADRGPAYAMREALEYRVYYLRYAWAEDVVLAAAGRNVTVPGVASILRSVMGDGAPNVKRTEQLLPATVPGLRGQGLSARGRYPDGRLGYDPAAGPMPAANEADAWQAAEQRGGGFNDGAPSAVRIQADSRLNAVIIRDTRRRLDAYEPLIRALDVEPQLLEIQATIIDIDTERARDLGFAFQFTDKDGRNIVSFGDATSPTTASQRRGLVVSTVIRDGAEFRSRLTALEAQGVARVVSRPQVMTLSNVEALFDATRTFYVRLAGERDVDLFNVTAGTTLRVTPHVMRDNAQSRIRLLINIEDGSLTGERVDRIPVVARSTINTQAMIDAGQSLLLGGMVSQSDERATDKVPVLGDIPVVGNLFKSSRRVSGRRERLFLITPRLASSAGFVTPAIDLTAPGQPLPRPPALPKNAPPLPRLPDDPLSMPVPLAPQPTPANPS